MRIQFYTHYFPPEGNAPASRTHANCRRWVRAGHSVRVITCAPNVPDGRVYAGYRNRLFQREMIDGIEVIRVWTFIAANEGTFLRIANYVSYMISAVFFTLFMRRPDVIVATSPQFFCGWAGLIVSKLRRVPFVLEIRDIWPESIVAVGALGNRRLLAFLEWLEAKMYRWSPWIVTVGDGYRRRLLEKGVPDEKISIVMNGVDTELFVPREPSPEIRRRHGVPDGAFLCGYVGTIGMACGLEVVLRAARRLADEGREDIVFMMIGDGAVRESLEEQARELGLRNVVFTGRRAKDEIPDYIATLDACLVHLRKTGLFETVMPSKIFEAAGMERAILNGVGGFAAEFVEAAGAGICFESDDADALVEATLRLAANPELRARLGRQGREYVISRFDREVLAADYLRILERAAESATRSTVRSVNTPS